MKIKYDKSVDSAYIYLNNKTETIKVHKTYTCDPLEIDGEINLDFDSSGRLTGIEVLDASKKLQNDILNEAEIIG